MNLKIIFTQFTTIFHYSMEFDFKQELVFTNRV